MVSKQLLDFFSPKPCFLPSHPIGVEFMKLYVKISVTKNATHTPDGGTLRIPFGKIENLTED